MEFTYNASAVAAGGVIEKSDGSRVIIPSLAPVALSPSGGEGITTITNYVSDTLACSSAYTRVSGTRISDNKFTTETEVIITNLHVLGVLNIGMLRATVTSTRTVETTPGDDDHEFELDAAYDRVLVKRADQKWCEVIPKHDISIKSVKRYEHLRRLLENRPADDAMLVPCPAPKLLAAFNAPDEDTLRDHLTHGRPVLGALVEEVQNKVSTEGVAASHRHHNRLLIPGVGIVKFGELMLKPGRRRVNLLRISFDPLELLETFGPQPEATPIYSGGSLTLASVEGNGSPLWP